MEELSKRDRASERFVEIVEPLLEAGAPDAEIWARINAELSYDELLLVLMEHGPDRLQATAARFYGKLLRFHERWTTEEITTTLQRRGIDLTAMDPDNDADVNTIMQALEEADGLSR